MESKNLVELLKAVRPRSALFTTYTVSLAFVESVLLPTLRHVGCQDVTILVDANEFASSLEETQARGAGRRYRLAPLLAPNGGIFHPKLAYLASEAQDVLVIGSGNLTVAGQNKQLECLDAVANTDYPAVFADLSALAAQLALDVTRSSPQAADVLRGLAQRASQVAAAESKLPQVLQDSVRLIHTLTESASSQLIQFWQKQNLPAAGLTALSPYHAPDAGPLKRLCSSLNVSKLQVGLDSSTCIAPFTEQAVHESTLAISFVTPKSSTEKSALHAKVFEISSPKVSLVLTGSVNATVQSLETKKNIEVSLARLVDKSPFTWTAATPSTFNALQFKPKSRDENFAFLDASLQPLGWVEGVVLGSSELPLIAEATLFQQEQPLFSPISFALKQDGTFRFRLPKALSGSMAIQLSIRAERLRARCWLSLEEVLAATDQERREKQVLHHLLAGSFSNEDVLELFQMLNRVLILPAQTAGKTAAENLPSTTPPEASPGADEPFSFVHWQRSGRSEGLRGSPSQSSSHHEVLRAFMRWVYSGRTSSQAHSVPATASSEEGDEGFKFQQTGILDEEPDGSAFFLEEHLHNLIAAIPEVLQKHPEHESGPRLALVAGAYALKLTAFPRWTDSRAYRPLLHWLESYSRYSFSSVDRAMLTQFALGAACLVAALGKRINSSAPFSALKDQLLRFEPSFEDEPPSLSFIERALDKEMFTPVSPELKQASVAAFKDIWDAPSLDQRIEELISNALNPNYLATTSDEAEFPGGVKAIRAITRANAKARYHGVVQSQKELENCGCPHCYQAYGVALKSQLRANHFIVCPSPSCRKAIFYFENLVIAERVKELLLNA